MGEWQHELSNLEKTLTPLIAFNNQFTTAGPHEDPRVRRAIVEKCVQELHYFPKIQMLCEQIQEADDLHFDKVYAESGPQIRTEVGLFEASIQAVVTHMTVIRAVMAAVNDGNAAEAEKQLKVLDDEVMKQAMILMNDRVSELQVILGEFRRHQVTQNLALQNLDNVLDEVMIDDFYSVDHALVLEDPDYRAEFQERRASEILAEQKLEGLAGELEKEFNSDTSQETEDLMESVIQYRQKTIKYAKMNELVREGRFHVAEQHLLDETELLRQKEKIFQAQINRIRVFYENVFLMPLESASKGLQSIENDQDMRALTRFEVKMALNYMMTDERQKCANRLEAALRRLNQDLEGVVESIKSVNQQIELISRTKKDADDLEAVEDLRREVLNFQEYVLYDQSLEEAMRHVRHLLRESKNKEAAQKILNLLEYSESFNYRIAQVSEDADLITQEVQEAYQEKDYALMGQRGEDLYHNLQKLEKDVSLLYTIRRVLHLGVSQDRPAADKVLKQLAENVHKEYLQLKEQQKKLDKVAEIL